MDKLHYLAHVAEDGREQTVLAHLEGTAALCAAFAAGFDAGEQGRLAGLAHDIGKYSDAFQRRIRGSPEQVDHTPKARPGRFCNACSLKDLCLPQLTRRGAVSGYLRKAVDELV